MSKQTHSLATLVRSAKEVTTKPWLVVLLHGYGSNETDLFSLERIVPSACVVVSVRAPLVLGAGAYAWFSLRSIDGKLVSDKEEAEAARLIFREFLEAAVKRYEVDPSRVILVGFSQGAMISASTLLSSPESVSGIVMLSGRVLREARPLVDKPDALSAKRVFIGHGVLDPVIPVEYAREAKTYFEHLHLMPEYHEYPMGHEVSNDEMKDLAQWIARFLAEPRPPSTTGTENEPI